MTNYIVSKKRENFIYWVDFEDFKLNLNTEILDFQTFLFSFLSLKYD